MHLKPQRKLKNKPEQDLAELAAKNGWEARKRGWPDFWCVNSDGTELIAIECKPRLPSGRLQLLKREQNAVMALLTKYGIKCYISDGKTLEKYCQHEQSVNRRKSSVARKNRLR